MNRFLATTEPWLARVAEGMRADRFPHEDAIIAGVLGLIVICVLSIALWRALARDRAMLGSEARRMCRSAGLSRAQAWAAHAAARRSGFTNAAPLLFSRSACRQAAAQARWGWQRRVLQRLAQMQ